jgi:hypothetical protein
MRAMMAETATCEDTRICDDRVMWNWGQHRRQSDEEVRADLQATIAEHGWALIYVPDDDPPIHYTVGLTDRDLSELILFGCDEAQGGLLNDLADLLVHGRTFADGEPIHQITEDDVKLELHTVTKEAPAGLARFFYGQDVQIRQLVLPDAAGRMPWQPDACDPFTQKLLFEPPHDRPS